jgi:hypothetical protein
MALGSWEEHNCEFRNHLRTATVPGRAPRCEHMRGRRVTEHLLHIDVYSEADAGTLSDLARTD